jgi:DNA-binding transcriptional ArsR family regulator
MNVPNRRALDAIEERLRAVANEQEELFRLQRTLGGDVERQDLELENAWKTLGETFIPELSPTVLDACAQRLQLRPVSTAAVMAQRQATLSAATAERTKLLENPKLKNAEGIENEAQIRLAELKDAMQPLEASTKALRDEPLFTELLEHRYDTDEYQVRFWQSSFYRHWKHGDLVVEAHGVKLGLARFRDIAARYIEELAALNELTRAARVHRDELSALQYLRDALAKQEQTIAHIDTITLQLARNAVVEHLRPLGERDLVRLVGDDGPTSVAVKRVLGIQKKREYLRSMAAEQLAPSLADLKSAKDKLSRTRTKLGRPKNANRRWSTDEVQRMIGRDRSETWTKRRTRLNEGRTRVVSFQHYDRWDPIRDMLWWDVMTDGQLDGNFIPEVREHRHHHHVHDQHRGADESWRDHRDVDIS